MRKQAVLAVASVAVAVLVPGPARAQSKQFAAGSLIIPMDVDYQDEGMFQAYGMLYQLLLHDVPVYWVIRLDKEWGGVDFEAEAQDVQSGQDIGTHGYRGGPFVVDSEDATRALAVVSAWQAEHVTTVHRATAPFTGYVSKLMTVAPTIAVFADGNEDIAFGYLNAAGIPDSLGQAWPDRKDPDRLYPGYPDVLSVEEVRGPDPDDPSDGALFDDNGLPVYCQLMTMHWGVNERDEGAIAEIRQFLNFPTHFFAECQAVNAVENAENGHFLTPNGYIMDDKPDDVDFLNAHLPFAQLDGPFQTVGGSEPSYTLPEGDEYYDMGVVMITEKGTPIGVRDVWMTGYLDGICEIDPVKGRKQDDCQADVGKVSYLGGHRYSTKTPISEHPDAQGTRLFLNALFEADCVTTIGQPQGFVNLQAPAWTPDTVFEYTVTYQNAGAGVALDAVLVQVLDEGVTLESASVDPTVDGTRLVWDLGNMAPHLTESITVRVRAPGAGEYRSRAVLEYRSGQNQRSAESREVVTRVGGEPPSEDAGSGDAAAAGNGDSGPSSGAGASESGCNCRSVSDSPAGSLSLLLLVFLVVLLRTGRRRQR